MILASLRDEAFLSARRRVVLLWRPMAMWTVLVWAVMVALLAPFTSAILGRQVLGAEQVWGNDELLRWLLSPRGALYAVLSGSVIATAAVVRFAGLFQIVTDHLGGKKPGVTATVRSLVPQIPSLIRISVFTAFAAAVLLLPLLAGLAGVYLAFLTDFDINYYLEVRPPALHWASALGIGWAFLWATGSGYLAARFVPALPAYLDGYRPLRKAIRVSWERTRSTAPRLIRLLTVSAALWLSGRALAAGFFFFTAQILVESLASVTDSLSLMLFATAAYTAGTVLLDALLSFAGFSLVATVIMKVYFEETDLHQRVPPLPPLGELTRRAVDRVVNWVGKGRLAGLTALVLLTGAVGAGWLLEPPPPSESVVVIAHRAGPALAPENTLLALERAISAGADWIEIDVQRTADGVLVVVHDADLMRVAGRATRVSSARSTDLVGATLGQGAGIPPSDLALATLVDFLERARGRTRLLIELKYYAADPLLAPQVVEEVRRAGMAGEVAFMSLDVSAVRQLAELAPEIQRGYLSAATVGDLSSLPIDFVAVAHQRLSRSLIRRTQGQGRAIYAWTLNEPGQMVAAIDAGVDGIITDDPRLARGVLQELEALTATGRLLLRFRNLVVDPTGLH